MKKKQITYHNSFTEFLLYITHNRKVKVEIFRLDETIWLMKLVNCYNLDAILSVDYQASSAQATQLRI